MMRFSIKAKILLASSLTILIVTAFTGILLKSEDALARLMNDMIQNNVASMRASEQIKHDFVRYDGLVFRYLATDEAILFAESARMKAKVHEWILQRRKLAQSGVERDLLIELEEEVSRYDQDVQTLMETYRFKTPSQKRSVLEMLRNMVTSSKNEMTPEQSEAAQKQAIALLSAEGRARMTRIYSLCERLSDISRSKLEEAQDRVQRTVLNTQFTAFVAGAAVLTTILIITIVLAVSILGPLRNLLTGVQKVTAGDLDLELDLGSSDEIGSLTHAFNTMTRNLREKQQQLINETITDSLTELHNFRYFQSYLRNEISRAARHGRPFSLLILDIDHFKQYNDANGHQMGNVVLKQVANILKESLRAEGMAARYGGEEFVIGLPETTAAEARIVAERLRAAIESSDFPGQKSQASGKLTISLGGASFPDDGTVAQQLIEKADKALYAAKDAGRNRVHWAS